MVEITRVYVEQNYIVVAYLTNGINISTRVYDHERLTPQDIIEAGYKNIRSLIETDCVNAGIVADHELPEVEDALLYINMYGLSDVYFTEGQEPVELKFRCAATTLYGKIVDVTKDTTFYLNEVMLVENSITLKPEISADLIARAEYGHTSSTQGARLFYKSQKELELENIARVEEAKRRAEELAALPAEPVPPTTEERLAAMEQIVADVVSLQLGV